MSEMFSPTVPAEVEARAGAPDTDKPKWLAERLGGVTATEVRDLMVKGAPFRLSLLEEKRSGVSKNLCDNKYLAWGRKREDVNAQWLLHRFGLAWEHRVFHGADEPRFLASPDGLGVDAKGLLVGYEHKTSSYDIAPGSEHFEKVGYALQVQWCMYVLGAQRWLYVWEQHDGNWLDRGGEFPEPEPWDLEPSFAWIDRDEKVIAQLVKAATAFLGDLEEDELTEALSPLGPAVAEYLRLEAQIAPVQERMAELKGQVAAAVKSRGALAVDLPEGRIVKSVPKPAVKFQQKLFEKDHPVLYKKYRQPGKASAPSVKISPLKLEKGDGDE